MSRPAQCQTDWGPEPSRRRRFFKITPWRLMIGGFVLLVVAPIFYYFKVYRWREFEEPIPYASVAEENAQYKAETVSQFIDPTLIDLHRLEQLSRSQQEDEITQLSGRLQSRLKLALARPALPPRTPLSSDYVEGINLGCGAALALAEQPEDEQSLRQREAMRHLNKAQEILKRARRKLTGIDTPEQLRRLDGPAPGGVPRSTVPVDVARLLRPTDQASPEN